MEYQFIIATTYGDAATWQLDVAERVRFGQHGSCIIEFKTNIGIHVENGRWLYSTVLRQ